MATTTTIPLRPLLRQTSKTATSKRASLTFIPVRHESTTRRMTKALRVKPTAAHTANTTTNPPTPHDHIIFNPPSSAPNIYHTPLKFLPPSDPRRALRSPVGAASSTPFKNPSGTRSMLPPPLRQPYEKRYHLREQDVEEMRHLRDQDPKHWTRIRLAEKFDCSRFFVAMACQSSKAHQQAHHERLAETRAKWGPKKRRAMEDRIRRRETWGRDL